MGSSASKTARAAGGAARRYPTAPSGAATSPSPATSNAPRQRQPPPPPPPSAPPAAAAGQPGPTVRPQPHASGTRSEVIDLDASDPDFVRSLRSLGPVQPNPTMSPSSLFPHSHSQSAASSHTSPIISPDPRKNPAVMLLEARARLQTEADREFQDTGKRAFAGRRFLDVGVLRQVLMMRERGMADERIEQTLELQKGVLSKLGPKGLFGYSEVAPDQKGVVDLV